MRLSWAHERPQVLKKIMARRFAFTSLFALLALASAEVNIVERPMKLYSTASPKLRIQTDASSFAGILEQTNEGRVLDDDGLRALKDEFQRLHRNVEQQLEDGDLVQHVGVAGGGEEVKSD